MSETMGPTRRAKRQAVVDAINELVEFEREDAQAASSEQDAALAALREQVAAVEGERNGYYHALESVQEQAALFVAHGIKNGAVGWRTGLEMIHGIAESALATSADSPPTPDDEPCRCGHGWPQHASGMHGDYCKVEVRGRRCYCHDFTPADSPQPQETT